MTQHDAVRYLRVMMATIQHMRSVSPNEFGATDTIAADLLPWIYGPRCPLPALARLLDRVEGGGRLAPADFYNMMLIATQRQPEIGLMAIFPLQGKQLPEPDAHWLAGWDDADQTREP